MYNISVENKNTRVIDKFESWTFKRGPTKIKNSCRIAKTKFEGWTSKRGQITIKNRC